MLAGIDEILDFWFDDAARSREALEARSRIWFRGGRDFDHEVRARFEITLDLAATGACAHWESEARGALALVVLFDQMPRNIHRGTAQAFAYDARALAIACGAVDAGLDQALEPLGRFFLYMPFEHAEDAAMQTRSVTLFDALAAAAPPALEAYCAEACHHAREHRDIVARFGRFPHRNRVLGRTSTPEEQAWLDDGAPRFGQ